MLNFFKGCFCIEMILSFLSLILFMCCIAFISLHMLSHISIPVMKPTWSWCNLLMCWTELPSIYWEFFLQGNVCIIFFLCFVFIEFWYQVNSDFIVWFCWYSFTFYFVEWFGKDWCSLKFLWNSTMNTCSPGLIFAERLVLLQGHYFL
jgi:hypothetical protein